MYYNQFARYFGLFFFVMFYSKITFSQSTPFSNPKELVFSEIKSFSFKVAYSKVKDATNYLVLVSQKARPLATPKNNESYFRGDILYDAKVAYVGKDTNFIPFAIRTNQTYHYVVYAFNGQSGNEKYQILNPTYNKISTKDLNIGNYYEGVSSASPNFTMQLHDLISNHKVIPYYNYKTTILEKIELKDTSNGSRYIECVYTGDKKVFTGIFDWTKLGFSREHTFAHSWMPTYPANNPEKPEYSDLHNLYPTNLEKANTVRNNYPFGEINGKVHYEFKQGRLGEMNGSIVYEPANSQKGNVARSIFYMLIAYNFMNNQWQLPLTQDEEILKKWHFQDLPDDYEKTRQEFIYEIQGNRNPFIDSIEFVCKIDFYKMIKSKKCIAELDRDLSIKNINILYDDNKKMFVIKCELDTKFSIYTISGQKINQFQTNTEIPYLDSGLYTLVMEANHETIVKKIFF